METLWQLRPRVDRDQIRFPVYFGLQFDTYWTCLPKINIIRDGIMTLITYQKCSRVLNGTYIYNTSSRGPKMRPLLKSFEEYPLHLIPQNYIYIINSPFVLSVLLQSCQMLFKRDYVWTWRSNIFSIQMSLIFPGQACWKNNQESRFPFFYGRSLLFNHFFKLHLFYDHNNFGYD